MKPPLMISDTGSRISFLFLAALLLILFLPMSCSDNEDDDDNDGAADDDTPSPEDCVPADASEENRDNALAILDYHLGTYEDLDGLQRLIECDPDGEFDWPQSYNPDAGVIYSYLLPIKITLLDTAEVISARLDVAFNPPDVDDGESINAGWVSILFTYQEISMEYSRTTAYNEYPIKFLINDNLYLPDRWNEWTKVD
ncbi:MAG: hypothetical protein GX444_03855 [Myxococcales bacterium]|nr:hypothetical protein [Myxococcales bacterium]